MSGKLADHRGFQLTALVALRLLVGWHFLYEGVAKLTNPRWSSSGYLLESKGRFAEHFIAMANNEGTLAMVDQLNQWGLLLIGLALVVGILVRSASVAGILLLALYYLAAPPFPGLDYAIPTEGSYLFVNKILVEIGALLVILGFPTSHQIGLDRLIHLKRAKTTTPDLATGD